MTAHDGLFWSVLGFIAGTALPSVSVSPLHILIAGSLVCIVMRTRVVMCLLCTTGALLGSLYFTIDDYQYRQEQRHLETETIFEGTVSRVPRVRDTGQSAYVTLTGGEHVLIYTNGFPHLTYGAMIRIAGTLVLPPPDSFGKYLAANHIAGSIFSPTITYTGESGSRTLAALFEVREHMRKTLAELFTHDAYALMAAILLGDRDALSPAFTKELSASGTLHVTALSGGHITIIAVALQALCAACIPRRKSLSFLISSTGIVLFVAMTGFVISAVRAALMGIGTNAGTLFGRHGNPRTIIACTAFLIALTNPKTVAYDVGFQLSCLATIGIIYGTPLLMRLSFFSTPGYAGWRLILAATFAAQVAVFPLTVSLFENFSFSALPANIAVVAVMPALTVGGFVAVMAGSISPVLGAFIALPLALLLTYTEYAVHIFAAIWIPFNPRFTLFTSALYYALCLYAITRESATLKAKP